MFIPLDTPINQITLNSLITDCVYSTTKSILSALNISIKNNIQYLVTMTSAKTSCRRRKLRALIECFESGNRNRAKVRQKMLSVT